jgi:hypothetical protein
MGHPPTAERLVREEGSAELRSALASPDPFTRAPGGAAPGVEELAVEALVDPEAEVRVAAYGRCSDCADPEEPGR